jgi:hypothetical protein
MIFIRAHHSRARAKRAVGVVALLGIRALPLAVASCGADGYLGDLLNDAGAPNVADTSYVDDTSSTDAASEVGSNDAFVPKPDSSPDGLQVDSGPDTSAHDSQAAPIDASSTLCAAPSATAPSGSAYWARLAGFPRDKNDEQRTAGLAVDSSGNLVVIGSFLGSINLGGDTLVSLGDPNFESDVYAPSTTRTATTCGASDSAMPHNNKVTPSLSTPRATFT